MTESIEDYLKAIYHLTGTSGKVSTNDIARELTVSAPSATNMIKKLADMNLIEYERYQGAALTEKGRQIALEVIRHHRLLELYLVEALGYEWDEVHEEADRLEHVISETFEDRIAEYLGHPEFDPHGEPIPTKDGKISPTLGAPLQNFKDGNSLIVSWINDRDPDKLRYLGRLGLYPGVILKIDTIDTIGGIMWIEVEDARHPLSLEIAQHIFVELANEND